MKDSSRGRIPTESAQFLRRECWAARRDRGSDSAAITAAGSP